MASAVLNPGAFIGQRRGVVHRPRGIGPAALSFVRRFVREYG